jgi:hypothetical protein
LIIFAPEEAEIFKDYMFILAFLFSSDLNINVDFSDFIFAKIYSKFDVRKKRSLNHKKIKAI